MLRLFLAAVFGGVIGYEREMKNKSAGLRTHILTALASALFTILTSEIYASAGKSGDPIRVIEAVTQGVAFLAAGAIIQSRGEVHGLTTGAAMWMSGALGVACGAGFYVLALISTLATIFVLYVMGRLFISGGPAPTADS